MKADDLSVLFPKQKSIMKKKILFVSVAFPPKNDPEALQVAKYFYYLQKHKDLQIDVVTSTIPTLYMPYDPNLESYTTGINQLINIPLYENRYLNYIRHRLGLQGTVFPDARQAFHKQYCKVLNQLEEKPDLIYSRADPKSSTVLAYKLQKELKVPWILHMSDPWADCPVSNLSGKYYKKNDEWERKCIEAAEIISLTSIPTVEFYKNKYPGLATKFHFYPNVYEYNNDNTFAKPEYNSAVRKFRIIYTGGIVEPRNPAYYLKPLSEIYKEHPAIADQIEVIFAGDADARCREEFKSYNLPFVKWIGRVSYKDTLQLQQSADYLLCTDNPVKDPKLAMFFSSKLLDYMVARKRILSLTVEGSATDQVMRDLKGDVCDHDDTAAIKSVILKAFNAFKEGDKDYLTNNCAPQKYEASYNADRLYNEIVGLIPS